MHARARARASLFLRTSTLAGGYGSQVSGDGIMQERL